MTQGPKVEAVFRGLDETLIDTVLRIPICRAIRRFGLGAGDRAQDKYESKE
jgi:hypothetical protein